MSVAHFEIKINSVAVPSSGARFGRCSHTYLLREILISGMLLWDEIHPLLRRSVDVHPVFKYTPAPPLHGIIPGDTFGAFCA